MNNPRPHFSALIPLYILVLLAAPVQAFGAAPSEPTPLSLTAECRAGYNLVSWSVIDNQKYHGYRVYRSLSAGGPYTVLCAVFSGEQKSCRDRNVSNGTRYFYIARVVDFIGHEGASSNEASVVADTVPPSANLSPPIHNMHYSGKGPAFLQGKTVDGISGVAEVRTAIRRNDTMEWWDGSAWKSSPVPVYRKALLEKNGILKWKAGEEDVIWSQATSYYVRVAAIDNAGFLQDPSDNATIYVDTPAGLSLSIAAAPASVVVGQVVNVSVLVANTGGTNAESILVYPLEGRGDAKATPIRRVQPAVLPPLGPGEFTTVSWSYSPTAAGTLVFSTTSSGIDSVNGSAIGTPAALSNPVAVRKAANLDVSISPLPANIRQGAPLLIRMFVTNVGESDAQVTSLRVAPSRPGVLAMVTGPEPLMPQQIKAGQTREFLWRAQAALPGEIRLSGQAAGYDESSGLSTNSGQQPAIAVGVASAPGSITLSASADSVIVKSKVGLVAEVRDKSGIPVPGVAVSFSVISGKGRVRPDIAVTDELGKAQAELVSGTQAGINTVEARVGSVLSAVSIESVAPGGAGQGLSRNFFDPGREPLEVKVNIEKKGRINITVRTLGGETVAVLADREAPAGTSVFTWNGRDNVGKNAPNGLYYILIQTDQGTTSRRVSVLAR
jgi:hypothetical protein